MRPTWGWSAARASIPASRGVLPRVRPSHAAHIGGPGSRTRPRGMSVPRGP